MSKKKKRKNSRQFNERFRKKFFTRNSLLVWAIAIILCVGIVIGCVNAEKKAQRYQNQIDELSTEISDLKDTNSALRKEIDNINTDEYIEKIARERLGMVKKGEYSLKESTDDTDESEETTQTKDK